MSYLWPVAKDTQIALRLKKGLHTLKQAPRLCNKAVDRTLKRLKFTLCKSDPCIYVRLKQDDKGNVSFAIIAIHVDDLIVTSNSSGDSNLKACRSW